MITFLRKVRKSFIDKGSFSRYVFYAIGEILLVVIEILIALQVNEWNEGRKNKIKTKAYVARMIEDLRADSLMLISHLDEAALKAQHCKEIKRTVEGSSKGLDTSRFIVLLQSVGRLDLPPISDNTYQDLQSSGNLSLINDVTIREAIRNYYNEIPHWWFDQYSTQLVDGYLPIAVDAIPMRIHEKILGIEKGQPGVPSLYFDKNLITVTPDEFDQCIAYLKDNEDFFFNLKRINRSHLVHVKLLSSLQNNANRLIQLLQTMHK